MQYLHNRRAQLEKKAVVNKICCELLSRMGENGEETLYDEMEPTDDTRNSKSSSLSTSLKYELTVAEQMGKRGILLENIYQMIHRRNVLRKRGKSGVARLLFISSYTNTIVLYLLMPTHIIRI